MLPARESAVPAQAKSAVSVIEKSLSRAEGGYRAAGCGSDQDYQSHAICFSATLKLWVGFFFTPTGQQCSQPNAVA